MEDDRLERRKMNIEIKKSSNQFDKSNEIRFPIIFIDFIKQQETNIPLEDDIRQEVKEYAIDICEIFEDLLEKYEINIPDEYREGDESEARLYGENYYETEEKVIDILVQFRNDLKEIRTSK